MSEEARQCWELSHPHDTPAIRLRCVMEQGHDPVRPWGHVFGGLGPFTPGATRWRGADGKLHWTFEEKL